MSSKSPHNPGNEQQPRLGLPVLGTWLQAVAPSPVGEVASRATEAERQIARETSAGQPERPAGPRDAAPYLVKRSARLSSEAQLTPGNAAAAKTRLAEALMAFWRGDYEVARERMRLAQFWDPAGEMTGAVGRQLSELLDRRRDLAELVPKTP